MQDTPYFSGEKAVSQVRTALLCGMYNTGKRPVGYPCITLIGKHIMGKADVENDVSYRSS